MKGIELYIGGRSVDIDNNVSIPFNYAFTDMSNPTAVKNSFSKNVEIKGTANNNKIFGHFFLPDRRVGSGSSSIGADFDPMKRVEFQLRHNGDILESGYCKLGSVKRKGDNITYSVTLYGGLGDFLYNLSQNDEEGNKPTLASLWYKVRDDNGRVMDKESEMNFRITKDIVKKAWDTLGNDGNKLFNYINFVPCYNGEAKNFDNNKAIIKIDNNKYWNSYVKKDSDFAPKNGYCLAELATSHDEWEAGELRSYLQRPCVKVKKVMEAISDPDNNGGYTVNWDTDFANANNPVWEESWIALNQLDLADSGNEIEKEGTVTFSKINYDGKKRATQWLTFTDVNGKVINDSDGYILTDDLAEGSKFSGDTIYMQMRCDLTNTLFISRYTRRLTTELANSTPLPVRFFVDDVDNQTMISGYIPYSPWSDWTDAHQPWFNTSDYKYVYKDFTNVRAKFDDGYLVDMDGNALLFQFNIKDIVAKTKSNRIRIGFEVGSSDYYSSVNLYTSRLYSASNTKSVKIWCEQVKPTSNDPSFTIVADGIGSGTQITKSILFGDASPADYLLSYLKTFGLLMDKDKNSKTIRIMTKNTWFNDTTIDIDDKIARDRDYVITPNTLESRYLEMKNEIPETFASEKYEKNHKRGYGELRLDTGWEFNSQTKDITESIIYKNAVMFRDKSVYYRNTPWYQTTFPTYSNDSMSVTIYAKNDLSDEKTKTVDIPAFGINPDGSYLITEDNVEKPCCYTLDGASKKPVNISDFLLFYCGKSDVVKPLTDDFGEMFQMNGKRCWFYTNDTKDPSITSVYPPVFSRYWSGEKNGTAQYTMDFGTPKEVYNIRNVVNDYSSIYTRFWKNYLTDLYNRNTKTVDCYVLIPSYTDMKRWMRSFFWFDNSIWVLNKVVDFDQTRYQPVKCQFIKVLSKADYTGGQSLQNI